MPIGTGIIYNVGDLILSQVSGSGTSFLETKIAAATSSIVYFDSTARINSASLSSLTVGTASYVSGSTSIITNLTASNISASGTSSFGYVGIGTTLPSAKLDVVGSAAISSTLTVTGTTALNGAVNLSLAGTPTVTLGASTTYGVLTATGTNAASIYLNGATRTGFEAKLQFGAAEHQWFNGSLSSQIMTLNTTGLGIGTTTPNNKLHVYNSAGSSTTASNAIAVFEQSGNAGIQVCVPDASEAGLFFSRNGAAYYSAIARNGTDLTLKNNSTTAVTINSSGNVGIGTTSPTQRLHVYSAGGGFEFGVGSSNCYIETIDRASVSKDLNTGYYTRGTGSFTWNNAAYTERMRIDGSGSVLIGVNGAYNSSRLLQVKDGLLIGNSFYTFASIDTNGTADLILSSNANPANLGSNSNIIFKLGTSAGGGPDEKMRIVSNGNVGIGTTSPTGSLQVNKSSQTLGATTPSGATIISNLAGGNGILELGVDTTNLAYIQSRNITDQTYYKLLLNPSGGSVGIGTTAPGALLEISSSTAASLLNIKGAGGNGLLFVSGSGLVGIGTTNPVNTLSVYGEASLRLDNTFYWNGYYNAGYKAIAAGYASYINTWSTGDVVIANINVSASSAGSSITFRERYRINKDGVHTWEYVNNVAGTAMTLNGTGLGIGTSSPSAKLQIGTQTYGTAPDATYFVAGNDDFSGPGPVGAISGYPTAANKSQVTASIFDVVSGWEAVNGSHAILRVSAYNVINSTPAFVVLCNGNVGIGTSSPGALLEVSSSTAANLFNIKGAGGNGILFVSGSGNVGIGTTAPAAKLEISGSSNSVLLNIKSAISGAILYVSGSGAVGIGTSNVGDYTLQVNGSFAATTKSFVIEHPTKAGKKLIYGSLESPYHGIRLTGKDTLVNGKCKIQLPDYMYKLILHDSVNIQLTGIKCNKTLYIDDINIPENYFTIAYDKAIFESYKDYDFFWDFTAIRADVPELQTEM